MIVSQTEKHRKCISPTTTTGLDVECQNPLLDVSQPNPTISTRALGDSAYRYQSGNTQQIEGNKFRSCCKYSRKPTACTRPCGTRLFLVSLQSTERGKQNGQTSSQVKQKPVSSTDSLGLLDTSQQLPNKFMRVFRHVKVTNNLKHTFAWREGGNMLKTLALPRS